ncbi:MAG: efflux RND transporter periplasmic adaptor subunit [Polyangiales bacterium]
MSSAESTTYAVVRWTVVALSVTALGLAVRWRFNARAQREALAIAEAGPARVLVVRPRAGEASVALSLPGTARPQQSTALYARANGYARVLRADLGDRVSRGQLLAIIDAPEIADQLRSASARLREATDNVEIIRGVLARTQRLVQGRFSPAADEDEARLRLSTAESARRTSRAEFERLSTLASYLEVRAPFDGTITRRYIQQGALVTSGTTMLYDIATTQELRVDVDVPQWAASSVREGVEALVTPREGGGQPTRAQVARTAGALDPIARTLRVELRLPPGAAVLSGAYVTVRFAIARASAPIIVPSGAVVANGEGTSVFTVDHERRAHRVRISLGRDLGRDVEVEGAVTMSDRVLVFPPATLADGERIEPVERAAVRDGG